jgi:DMSO/TMAO reductase YedYZ molybdopterin-dependent catalytic subunit
VKRAFIGMILIVCLLLSACSSEQTKITTTSVSTVDTISSATLSRYRENEIRDYQGVRLDPAIGPSDNSISGVQHVDINNYQLSITGLVSKPVILTYDDVLKMTAVERLITLHCVTGWQATILWRGVQLSEILNLATVKPEANTVIFLCADGYTTSMPLSTIIDNKLIMAYSSNGLPLPDEMGYPFMIVAEDKFGYKWARWVNQIQLSADSNYQGYWESRGYDNEANFK